MVSSNLAGFRYFSQFKSVKSLCLEIFVETLKLNLVELIFVISHFGQYLRDFSRLTKLTRTHANGLLRTHSDSFKIRKNYFVSEPTK